MFVVVLNPEPNVVLIQTLNEVELVTFVVMTPIGWGSVELPVRNTALTMKFIPSGCGVGQVKV